MSLDKLMSKSKTNYKVYTPYKVAREIVAKALSLYFTCNKKEKLMELRAIDLSCGNGNLLLVLIESLIKISKIYNGKYEYNSNWVEGYDIDGLALEEFKSRLMELFAKYGVDGEIKLFNEDSLNVEFKNSYNIVLGNPPYLGEKNNSEIFKNIKKTEFGKKYYEGKMDYLYFFIEKGMEILKPKGILSYITTNYWLRAEYAKKLRETIRGNFSFVYINNINKSVFKDALGQHNLIFTLQKAKVEKLEIIIENKRHMVKNLNLYDEKGKIVLQNEVDRKFSNKLLRISKFKLGDVFNVNQGIVSGYDKAFVSNEKNMEFEEYSKPFYKNKDIHKYYIDEANYQILYLDGKKEPKKKLLEYLLPHKEKLGTRRESKNGHIKWWQLQWSRDESIFQGLKIVARQRNRANNFALVENDFYASADVYYISPKNENICIYWVLAYLNSEVFYDWFKLNGKYKGEFLELYATPLKEVPIIYSYDENELNYMQTLVKSIIFEYTDEKQKEINEFFKSKLSYL